MTGGIHPQDTCYIVYAANEDISHIIYLHVPSVFHNIHSNYNPGPGFPIALEFRFTSVLITHLSCNSRRCNMRSPKHHAERAFAKCVGQRVDTERKGSAALGPLGKIWLNQHRFHAISTPKICVMKLNQRGKLIEFAKTHQCKGILVFFSPNFY